MLKRLLNFFRIYRYDVSDCPFVPSAIDGHPVLCMVGDTAICG